jgi:hypothetical protein
MVSMQFERRECHSEQSQWFTVSFGLRTPLDCEKSDPFDSELISRCLRASVVKNPLGTKLHHRRSSATFVLWWLAHGRHMRMPL